jgi:hypothetical protein
VTSANDNLGDHLLGRRPMPADDRDYELADYLDAVDEIHARLTVESTVAELIDGGYLTTWHGILAFWRWLKTVLEHPEPAPAPEPAPGPEPAPPGPDPTPPGPPEPAPEPAPEPSAGADVLWTLGPISDQGQTGHCVGFTGLDWGNTEPVDDHWPNAMGDELYYACKVVDGEPNAEDGSHSRSLCKVLRARGRIAAYAFTTDVAVIADYVRAHGPVGIGIPWDRPMFEPDADGYVWPDGDEAGGHEVLVTGHLPHGRGAVSEESFRVTNHWGADWGDGGSCYITEEDLQSLLDRGGDAWAALENPLA